MKNGLVSFKAYDDPPSKSIHKDDIYLQMMDIYTATDPTSFPSLMCYNLV